MDEAKAAIEIKLDKIQLVGEGGGSKRCFGIKRVRSRPPGQTHGGKCGRCIGHQYGRACVIDSIGRGQDGDDVGRGGRKQDLGVRARTPHCHRVTPTLARIIRSAGVPMVSDGLSRALVLPTVENIIIAVGSQCHAAGINDAVVCHCNHV